jgi:hypothetical protein
MPRRSLANAFGIPTGAMLLLMMAAWPAPGLAKAGGPTVAVSENNLAVAAPQPVATGQPGKALSAIPPVRANFLDKTPSADARRVADWAMASGDHGGLPFVVIDKAGARVFVFDATGLLRGDSMALLGFAHGDYSAPGIGTRKLAAIRPEERTTPAGRFVAALGHDLQADILWVDYAAAISLHRVVTGNPGDHRRQRLASNSPLDKRISYGCINVPPQFYDRVVLKTFTGTRGIVYILPEQRKLEEFFPLATPGAGMKK